MSFAITQAVIRKLGSRYGQEGFRSDIEEIAGRDRPPMNEIPEYREREQFHAASQT